MTNPQIDSQGRAENVLDGLKNAYHVVAVRHIHPWYAWATLAAVIGFLVGAVYVVNLQGKFVASEAAQRMRPDMDVPARSEGTLRIVFPINGSTYEDNPIFIVADGGSKPMAMVYEWSVVAVDKNKNSIGERMPLAVNYRQGVYLDHGFTAVATSFNDLQMGTYQVTVARTDAPNNTASITVTKPVGPVTIGTGGCTCNGMVVKPLGDQMANGDFLPNPALLPLRAKKVADAYKSFVAKHGSFAGYPFQVIATINGDAEACFEGQKVQSTITVTKDDGTVATLHTSGVAEEESGQPYSVYYSTAEAAQYGIPLAPFDESSDGATSNAAYASDDYKDSSDVKKHFKRSDRKIEWFDIPGAGVSTAGTIVQKRRFVHIVQNCTCNTKITMTSKNGVITEATFESDCATPSKRTYTAGGTAKP